MLYKQLKYVHSVKVAFQGPESGKAEKVDQVGHGVYKVPWRP